MSRRSPGKRESLHLFFRKTLVPFIWFLRRLFAWFGDGRTRRRRFRLPCTFPPLRFICWTIIGIGAFYVFLYFIGTLRFGYSFLLACTDFFIFFAKTSEEGRFFFNFRFADTESFSSTKRIAISLPASSAILFYVNSWRTRVSERGSSTRNKFALCNWLLPNSPWDLWS